MRNGFYIGTSIAFALLLANCGESAVCNKRDVLETVRTLFQEQQFGRQSQLIPGVIVVKEASATFQSANKETNVARCSVIVTIDLMQILKMTQSYSSAQLEQAKQNAARNGQETTNDNLVNYTVQKMASGENYVTVLP